MLLGLACAPFNGATSIMGMNLADIEHYRRDAARLIDSSMMRDARRTMLVTLEMGEALRPDPSLVAAALALTPKWDEIEQLLAALTPTEARPSLKHLIDQMVEVAAARRVCPSCGARQADKATDQADTTD
jgi:hypothetical protein